ncbi:hypothetical protein [Trichothermofontia sp.]
MTQPNDSLNDFLNTAVDLFWNELFVSRLLVPEWDSEELVIIVQKKS